MGEALEQPQLLGDHTGCLSPPGSVKDLEAYSHGEGTSGTGRATMTSQIIDKTLEEAQGFPHTKLMVSNKNLPYLRGCPDCGT